MGHVKDLPPKKLGVTINGTIDIEYEPIEKKDKTIADICKAASGADEVYLAPDPDREGEIIAWHIEQEIKKVAKKAKIHRITFNEITKGAIQEAIEHPHDVDLNKVAAQQARRVLDRWVGYEVSPILWVKLAPGLSAGRVQSVALRLICDREEAIRNFKPEEYWSIVGTFKHENGIIEAALTNIGKEKAEIGNKKDADAAVAEIKKAPSYSIDSVTDKERIKNPLPPFMTSTLQQAAFNQLGFSVKKTMQLAQQLYEGVPLEDQSTPVALITYMRTDSLRLSDTALSQAREFIHKTFDKEYLPAQANHYAKAKAKEATTQDAHEAVRPIDVFLMPEKIRKYLPKDLAQLYELIWKRFVACQMKPALYAQRQVVIKGGNFTFKVTGSTLIFDGFLKVYNVSDEEEEKEGKVSLPQGIEKSDALAIQKVTPKQHFTQPPPRFTEASLVKDLEKEGIGRPSTYATIMNTIRARAYTASDTKKRFSPTELGMTVTKMLVENLPKIMDIKFTAHMEEHLDKVAQGELDRDTLLRGFYEPFAHDVQAFKGSDGKRVAEPTDITCPKCGKAKLAIRFGKSGEFLGCLNYPACDFTTNFKRNETGEIELVKPAQAQMLDEKCPQCGKPLRQLVGKFGPFVACSGYPECKYIKHVKANFPCPLDKGDVVQRRWRGGSFWGCSNYPDCKFAVFGDIEETPCPNCKLPFLVKKVDKQGNVQLFCSDKSCGYKKE